MYDEEQYHLIHYDGMRRIFDHIDNHFGEYNLYKIPNHY